MESDQNNSKRGRKEEETDHEESSSSLSVAANFPEEVIQSILVKLPVKSLLRFRPVHKLWRSLISDPHFAKQHYHHHTNKTMTANRRKFAVIRSQRYFVSLTSVEEAKEEEEDPEFPDNIRAVEAELDHPFDEPRQPFILGSSNGLLLMCNHSQVLLWNPWINEYKEFPQESSSFMSYMMISDPHEPDDENPGVNHIHITGFGHDSTTDEYKAVIIIHNSLVTSSLQIYLLTSKTGLWTDTEYRHGFPYLTNICCSHGVTVNNGAPHWILQRRFQNTEWVIVYFDWSEERLEEVPLPDSLLILENKFLFGLADLGGYISVVVDSSIHSSSQCDVWVMKEHGIKESWTKLYVIQKSKPSDILIPLGFAKENKVLLLINNQSLVTYNLKTGEQALLSLLSKSGNLLNLRDKPQWPFDQAICMESLISPNGAEAAWRHKDW